MKIAALIACTLAAGCYKAGSEQSCTVRCNNNAQCSNGLTCDLGVCRDMALPPCSSDAGPPVDPDAPLPPIYMDAPPDVSLMPDAPIPDAPPGCLGTDLITFCPGSPTGEWVVAQAVQFDTSIGNPACAAGVTTACVVVYLRITVTPGGLLTAVGPRPLVLVATDKITVAAAGAIDVGSAFGTMGAGANVGACGSPTMGAAVQAASGGGAGGTFSGRGGYGGSAGTASGGTPASLAAVTLTSPRGGCPGTKGGGNGGGNPGNGGGGIVLIAKNLVDISGAVFARGSGAAGGAAGRGGGGGGSGGLIAIDAQSISILGDLIAGGGGGGGGGGGSTGGGRGGEAGPVGQQASGGTSGGGSADGGSGGQGSGPTVFRNGQFGESIMTQTGGGGGAGGGAGVIRLRGTVNTGASTSIVPPGT